MHAINVKHIRQIRTIEDSTRYNAIEKHFKEDKGSAGAEDESSITVIPIEKEIDIAL